jgi:hypothetical protein
MNDNHGIQGDVRATNLAVGQNATVNATAPTTSPELAQALEALQLAVAAHDGPADVKDALTSTVGEIQDELAAPEPDRGRLADRLKVVGLLAGTTSGVATAAGAVLTLVQRVV